MNDKRKPGRPKGLKPPKRQYPLKLDEETRGQLSAAAYWTRQSANAIVEQGIGLVLQRLQEAHNGGRPFPPRPGKLPFAEAPGTAKDTANNGGQRPTSGGRPKRRRGKERVKARKGT